MSDISNFLERALLDHSLGTTAYTMPATIYCALYTSDPLDDASGTEVTGGGYARQTVTFTAATTGAGTEFVTSTSNSADITFGPATDGTWGTVTHVALFDAVTAGNMLWHSEAPAAKIIEDGDEAIIRAGGMVVALD